MKGPAKLAGGVRSLVIEAQARYRLEQLLNPGYLFWGFSPSEQLEACDNGDVRISDNHLQ